MAHEHTREKAPHRLLRDRCKLYEQMFFKLVNQLIGQF
jgi:hypothetical protein